MLGATKAAEAFARRVDAEIAEKRAAARAKGYAEGYAEGRQEARQARQEVLQEVLQQIQTLAVTNAAAQRLLDAFRAEEKLRQQKLIQPLSPSEASLD